MDWYLSKEVEDVVVPMDYEQSSPDSWSQWGITAFGGSDFPKKSFNLTREELAFNGAKNFYTSIDQVDSNNERQNSNSSSMSQGLYNNLWNDQADYQRFTYEEARINHMDDLFFGSLLEEDLTKYPTKMDDTTTLANIFEGEMVNSHYIGSHGQCSEENSMEESVLQDLERVTAQFPDKTRICFRDAFYRLAESSKQSCHEAAPSLRAEVSESKTNVIDRAVANLMFNKFNFEENDDLSDIDKDAQVPIAGMPQPTAY